VSIAESIHLSKENSLCDKILSEVNTKFNEWLNKELADRGWNQSDLANRAGLGRGTISNIMNHSRKPGTDICVAIAHALNIPPEIVFRAASILPPIPERTARHEQLNALYDQLTPENQARIEAYIQLELETQRRQEADRLRRERGTGPLKPRPGSA
jgi:transcriptional regulator with XRE-family HTH domain